MKTRKHRKASDGWKRTIIRCTTVCRAICISCSIYLTAFIQGSQTLCAKTLIIMKKTSSLSLFAHPNAHQSCSFKFSLCHLKIFASYHVTAAMRRCKLLIALTFLCGSVEVWWKVCIVVLVMTFKTWLVRLCSMDLSLSFWRNGNQCDHNTSH